MWIVRLALRRPYTFVVASMLVAILGLMAILCMPTDIFPEINIPVIAVAFNYSGMTPEDMEGRIVTNFERRAHRHGQRHRTYREPIAQRDRRSSRFIFHPEGEDRGGDGAGDGDCPNRHPRCRPGTQPPLIIQYNASNVPILQLGLGSDKLKRAAVVRLRPHSLSAPAWSPSRARRFPIPTAASSGRSWWTWIRIACTPGAFPHPTSPTPSASQNLILPAGTTKIGTQEYAVHLNSSPTVVETLNDLPIKTVNGTTIYIKDVAARARRVFGAEQHRPRRRKARRADGDPQDRRRRRRWTSSAASRPLCPWSRPGSRRR